MPTTYLAGAATAQLNDAQRLLDAHVMVLDTGACRLSGTLNSCGYRDAAGATFARYRRPSVCRPGASRPDLLGVRLLR
jgi:hypothetical protein